MDRAPKQFFIAILVACLCSSAASAVTPSHPMREPQILRPVDDKTRVTLPGAVHPLANHHNDLGPVPADLPMDRMQFIFRRSETQEAELKRLIGELHNPASPNYHHWLSPKEFGERFGPSDQEIETVKAWLAGHGLSATRVLPGKQILEFSGNAGTISNAFHIAVHKYAVEGSTHFASATNPQIPAALLPVIRGFVSLNDFRPHRLSRTVGKAKVGTGVRGLAPQWTTTGTDGSTDLIMSPADFAVQYDLNALYSAGIRGEGQTVAVVGDSNINVAYIDRFQELFGLPQNRPHVVVDGDDPGIDGMNNPDGPNDDAVEAYLDIEWAGAIAPEATIDLVIAADTAGTPGMFLAAERAVTDNLASVVSVSFNSCERSLAAGNGFFATLWSQAAAQGMTVVVATGDSGAAGCDVNTDFAINGVAVNGIASTPYDVGVGGTDFYYSSWNQTSSSVSEQLAAYWNQATSAAPSVSLKSPIPEQPWNDSQFGSDLINYYADVTQSTSSTISGTGGGGSSCAEATYDEYGNVVTCAAGYPKPSWQAGAGVPDDHARDIPDVSLFAGDGINRSFYPICAFDGDCEQSQAPASVQVTGAGGTSFAAPVFGAIMALVNQRYGRQGQADFVLYPLAQQFPASFHDIAVGNNAVPCLYSDSAGDSVAADCMAASDPIDVDFGAVSVTEGELGIGSAPSYGAGAGYDLATGLGSIDANALLSAWSKVSFASTELTVVPSATSFSHGTPITVSGWVNGAKAIPTGQVALLTDNKSAMGTPVGAFSLDDYGNFNAVINNLPGGSYSIWGEYGGDGTDGPSTSPKTWITVSPEPSDITYSVFSGGPDSSTGSQLKGGSITYGQTIYLRAQVISTSYYEECLAPQNPPNNCSSVDPSPATGIVTFADSAGTSYSAAVNSAGIAEVALGSLSAGPHSIYPSYSGDSSLLASTASPIAFTVAKALTQINCSVNYEGSSSGQEVILTVRITGAQSVPSLPSDPTGGVTLIGAPTGVSVGAELAPSQIGGVATFVFPESLSAGVYSLTISYAGDANHERSESQQTIRIGAAYKLPSTIAATSTSTVTSPTAVIGVHVSVTGQLGQSAPTGGVEFSSAGYDLGTATLVPGSGATSEWSGVFNSQQLLAGANPITVQYEGDATYAPSATTLELSNPLSDFTLVPSRTMIPLAQGSIGSVSVNLASMNHFDGVVEFTCNAASGITCVPDQTTATLLSDGTTAISLSISASANANNDNKDILLTATSGSLVHTLGLTAFVRDNPQNGFTLRNSGNIVIPRGSSTGNPSTISVVPVNGFRGIVNLACKVTTDVQSTSPLPLCRVPSSTELTSTSPASVALSVSTGAVNPTGQKSAPKTVASSSGGVAAVMVLLLAPLRRRGRRTLKGVSQFIVLLLIAALGCGGCAEFTAMSGATSAGPAKGTYRVTVSGTANGQSSDTVVLVTVQ